MHRADAANHLFNATIEVVCILKIKVSYRATNFGGIGDDVAGGPGMEGAHSDDSGVDRVEVAGDDGLEGGDNLGSDDDGIYGLLRNSSVAPTTENGAIEGFNRRHECAFPDAEGPDRKLLPEMEANQCIDLRVMQNSSFDHRFCAAGTFFCGLKNKLHGARKGMAMGIEVVSSAEGDRNVTVMAAGVHFTGMLGFVVEVVLFMDGEGIHIGPNGKHGAGTIASDEGYNSRLGNASFVGDAPLGELFMNKLRRQGFGKSQLRVLVDLSTPGHDLGMKRSKV